MSLSKNRGADLSATVFVTDFGEVVAGPKWSAYYKTHIEPGMFAGKRTKKRKESDAAAMKLSLAVGVMAEIEWSMGGVLRRTP